MIAIVTFQINNLYGRITLTIMLFSIPQNFPATSSLNRFGYTLENELKLNLKPSAEKGKNARLMLSSIFKKSRRVQSKKRKSSDRGKPKGAKKQRQTLHDNLID